MPQGGTDLKEVSKLPATGYRVSGQSLRVLAIAYLLSALVLLIGGIVVCRGGRRFILVAGCMLAIASMALLVIVGGQGGSALRYCIWPAATLIVLTLLPRGRPDRATI